MSHHGPGLSASLPVLACLLSVPALGHQADAAGDDALAFDADAFTVRTLTVGDRTVAYRAYEGIVYVSKPVDAHYQSMNVFIPAAYHDGGSVRGYSAETAPIFLPNGVGGYMPGEPGTPGPARDGQPNAIAVALSRGYVVAAPGARGRTLRDKDGLSIGKAPAAIVDLKAAVRYLRHNDDAMPGSAERIVSNGTSAGGALSALLGATGNSPDYEPALRAVGAADERDDVYACSCYCPITNLDNADSAYEWMFLGVNDYAGRGGTGTMTAEQIAVSNQLARLFPPYLSSLGLEGPDGTVLSLDEDGNGSFRDYVKSFVVASAQVALDGGWDLSGVEWITTEGTTVTDVDLGQYVRAATRMKTAPAFDALDLRSPETDLFGTATVASQHFTPFGRDHGADASLADPAIVRMMNPMGYIGSEGVSTAPHWRIRHGAADRDTALAIPVILTTKLRNWGASVDFAAPWGQGHGGDYDLPELFAWVDGICR